MKKTMKILALALTVIIMMSVSTMVMATTVTPNSIKIDQGNSAEISSIGGKIIGVIQVIGIIISVAILVVLGIKYMMGSAEEKAEYKKTLIPYFVGAILIFGASAFAQTIYTWSQSLIK